jgi:hypothetical protein
MTRNPQGFDDGLAEQRPLVVGGAFMVTSATLLLQSLFWGTLWLYDAGLLPTPTELQWQQSQSSASKSGTAAFDDTASVSIEREDCFGTCPVYRLTLYGSGRIEFVGSRFVCIKGPVTAYVERELVQRLIHGMQENGFFPARNYTSYDVTDNAYVTTTLTNGTRKHTVRHYLGDLSAPRMLRWMEDRVDEVAASHRWIGVREIGGRACPQPDGTTRSIRDGERE